jgi:PAS domain-containing protein
MVVKDAAGRFQRVNQAWVDLTGIPADRAMGQNMGRLYPVGAANSRNPLFYNDFRVISDGRILPNSIQ